MNNLLIVDLVSTKSAEALSVSDCSNVLRVSLAEYLRAEHRRGLNLFLMRRPIIGENLEDCENLSFVLCG